MRGRCAIALFFGLLLGVAAFLIFFDLGLPSLWLDEIASLLNARYPVAYILELSSTLEEHPPLFYLLLKALMALGHADAVVRLLPAACGLGCVAMTAVVGARLFGWPAGLAAAALWLAMPQDLWLSRMVRPYTLWQFFFLCSLYFLARWIKRGRIRDVWGLLAANVLMVASHYMSFPLLAAEGVCLLAVRPPGRDRMAWSAVFLYGVGCAAVTAAAYFGLIRHSLTPGEIAGSANMPAEVARVLLRALLGALYLFDVPLARLAWFTAACLGLFSLRRIDRAAFRLLALLILIPLVSLFLLGKIVGLYPRHLSFLAPLVCLAVAGGMAAVPRLAARLPWIVTAILALALADPLLVHHKQFYDIDSYRLPIDSNYKRTADKIAAMFGPGTVASFSNKFHGNAVSWYLAQKPHPNPVEDQRLTPADATARLLYVASTHYGSPPFGYMAQTAEEFVERVGPGVTTDHVDTSTIFAVDVSRDPQRRIRDLPVTITLPMDYKGFFAKVAAIDGVRFHQNARGPAVVPTRNDVDAVVGMVFVNEAPPMPQDIFITVFYDLTSKESQLSVRTAFDDEPPTIHPLSAGYDALHQRQLRLTRTAPYKKLTVDVVMRCAALTPTLSGGNLETLRLRGLEALFCPEQGSEACRDQAEAKLAASMLDNYLEERFLAASNVRQEFSETWDDNVTDASEDSQPDWNRLTPADPGRPGRIRLNLTTDRPRLLFYPRIGRDSGVRVWAVEGGGARRLLFGLDNTTDHWTPVSAQYEMIVPPWLQGRQNSLEIELRGRWAQLWRLGDTVFF
jgi:hypothetical protein